jgi:hypothetical protein
MDLTKLKLQSALVTSLSFEDFAANNNSTSSGFLRITLDRKEEIEANEDSILLFFNGSVAAFKGEESETPSDSSNVFNLNVKFIVKYSGKFDVDTMAGSPQEYEWFYKKDAGIFLHSVANRFLSDTAYKNVVLPYQQ